MNLLADESVDGPIVERLRDDGHSVLYVAEMVPGIDDDEVLGRGNVTRALLVTADKDFGELVFRLRRVHAGVVLLRLLGLSPERKAEIVSAAFARHGTEFEGAFSVVTPGPIRIRRATCPAFGLASRDLHLVGVEEPLALLPAVRLGMVAGL